MNLNEDADVIAAPDDDQRADDQTEQHLREYVERQTGGRIVAFERQLRWRPAWFLTIERDGRRIALHLRGNREGGDGVTPFPDLRREAAILTVLHEQGIPVPRIYGVCDDPPAILMDAMVGSRAIWLATPEQRRNVTTTYMEAVARMHAIPADAFVAAGLERPRGAAAMAMAGIDAYMAQYLRTKAKPEPLVEFALAWLRRNVPDRGERLAFAQVDSGQFLYEEDRLTGMLDFEFGMLTDPLIDLASMRMRDSTEPLGDSFSVLCSHYERASGEALDHRALTYYTVMFATMGTMQFAGAAARPIAGAPHAVYQRFDLALRRTILAALMEYRSEQIVVEEPPLIDEGRSPGLIDMLADTAGDLSVAGEPEEIRKAEVLALIEWVRQADAFGADLQRRNLVDVNVLLDSDHASWTNAQAALEAFVKTAPASADDALMRYFVTEDTRRMMVFGPTRIGSSARGVALPPSRWCMADTSAKLTEATEGAIDGR